jgi:hypothetical protein
MRHPAADEKCIIIVSAAVHYLEEEAVEAESEVERDTPS